MKKILTVFMALLTFVSYGSDHKSSRSIRPAFIKNAGQLESNEAVKYYLKSDRFAVYFLQNEVVYTLRSSEKETDHIYAENVKVTFEGANKVPSIVASEHTNAVLNHYIDDEKITTSSHNRITYADLYPGIDLTYYLSDGALKYDLIVKPGADPSSIQMVYNARNVQLKDDGLHINTKYGGIFEKNPYSYQGASKTFVASSYDYDKKKKSLSFNVDAYDVKKVLVIDPKIDWSRLYGGAANEQAAATGIDASGNVYIAGTTLSDNLDLGSGGFQATLDEQEDGFVAKFSPEGVLIWASYYGGDGTDEIFGLTVDPSNNVWIVGSTKSTGFPVSAAASGPGGNGDAFVTKFDAAGNRIFSKLYGGTSGDQANAIVSLTDAEIFVTGETTSSDFPATAGTFQDGNIPDSGGDAFIMKIDGSGTITWASYYGGNAGDEALDITTDAAGNPIIVGNTASTNLPTVAPGLATNAGGRDAFVAKFNGADGSSLTFASYLGGIGDDFARGVSTDTNDNILTVGYTESDEITFVPTPSNFYNGGTSDAFIAKHNAVGVALDISYHGGIGQDRAWGVTTDVLNNVYINGHTESANFPISGATGEVIQSEKDLEQDAFFSIFNESMVIQYSTYLGGDQEDFSYDLAYDNDRLRVYILGNTRSDNLPITIGSTVSDVNDAYVFAVDLVDDICTFIANNSINGTASAREVCVNSGETVLVTGSNPTVTEGTFTYQYQIASDVDGPFTDLVGEDNKDFVFNPTTVGDFFVRRLIVSDLTTGCQDTTKTSQISVINDGVDDNTISSDQDGMTVCQSEVSIDGNMTTSTLGDITYQYQLSNDGVNFTDITGATKEDLDALPSDVSGNTFVRRLVFVEGSVSCQNVGNVLTFNITADDVTNNTISSAMEDEDVCLSAAAPINITGSTAVSAGTLTYDYQVITNDGNDTTLFADQGEDFLYNPTVVGRTIIRRVVSTTSSGCTDASNNLVFDINESNVVNNDIQLTSGSLNQCQEDDIQITGSDATGPAAISYQYQMAVNGGIFTNLSGQTNRDLTLSDMTPGNIAIRRLARSEGGGCAGASNVLNFTITDDEITNNTISSTFTDGQVCESFAPFLISGQTAETGPGGVVSYQFQVSTNNGVTFTDVGTDSVGLMFTPAAPGIYQIRRIATSSLATNGCTDASNVLSFEVIENFVSNNQISFEGSVDTTGGCVDFSSTILANGTQATASSGNISYQYQLSDDGDAYVNIVGGNNQDLIYELMNLGNITVRRLAISDANGCASISNGLTLSVTNDQIENNTISSVDGPIVCESNSPIIIDGAPATTGPAGVITYSYEVSGDNGTTFTTVGSDEDLNYIPSTAGTYLIRRVVSSNLSIIGCDDYSNLVSLTVNENLVSANQISFDGSTDPQSVCQDDLADLLVTGSEATASIGSVSYQYQVASDGVNFSNATNGQVQSISFDILPAGTSTVRRLAIGNNNGCTDISNAVVLNVFDNLVNGNVIGSDDLGFFCASSLPITISETVAPTGTGTISTQYQVRVPGGDWEDIAGATNEGLTYTPSDATIESFLIRRIATSDAADNGCFSASNVLTFIQTKVDISLLDNEPEICLGEAFRFRTNASSASEVTFNFDNGETIDTTGIDYTFADKGEYTVSATALSPSGCSATDEITVLVNDTPTVNAGSDILDVISGQEVQLNATVSSGTISWSSDPEDPNGIPAVPNPRLTPDADTEYTITATNGKGCTAFDVVNVFLNDNIVIPSAFTPGNDGKNDAFEIGNLENYYPKASYSIYNRWGSLVYATDNLVTAPWDGTFEGEALPIGVYYYTLDLKNGRKPIEGSVIILK